MDSNRPNPTPFDKIRNAEPEFKGKFNCESCDYVSPTRNCLEVHMKRHMVERPYKCDYSSVEKSTLGNYKRRHSGERQLQSQVEEDMESDDYMLEEPPQTTMNCAHCGFTTPYRGKLVAHMRSHFARPAKTLEDPRVGTGGRPSDFSEARNSDYQRNINEHSESSLCNYKTEIEADLREHTNSRNSKGTDSDLDSETGVNLNQREDVTEIPCEVLIKEESDTLLCIGNENDKDETKEDHEMKCEIVIFPKVSNGVEIILKCSRCDYVGKNKRSLASHNVVHGERKVSYKCPACEFEGLRREDLREHSKVHSGEKPFVCGVCQYRVKRKCDLDRHVKVHDKCGKVFRCSQCDYSTGSRIDLRRHSRSHADRDSKQPRPPAPPDPSSPTST